MTAFDMSMSCVIAKLSIGVPAFQFYCQIGKRKWHAHPHLFSPYKQTFNDDVGMEVEEPHADADEDDITSTSVANSKYPSDSPYLQACLGEAKPAQPPKTTTRETYSCFAATPLLAITPDLCRKFTRCTAIDVDGHGTPLQFIQMRCVDMPQ